MFKRQSHHEGSHEKSTPKWKWWIASILIPVTGIILALFRPEVRVWLGLEKPKPAVHSSNQSLQPQTTPASPSAPEATEPRTKHAKSKAAGGESASASRAAGSGNQADTGTQINAPQGIAIGGKATVNNPTVNNYGPPAVQLMWSASDAQAEAPTGQFAKAVTVKTNTSYSPVSIAIFCDADIEELRKIGVSMDLRTGYLHNDKKQGFLQFGNPPVTPDEPLTVIVVSKTPFNVLSVAMIKTKQP
jgi:hypothetical protein